MSIEFGRKYQDRITGFAGVAVGHTTYISGCSQVLLAPSVDKDGKMPEAHWFDVQRLEPLPGATILLDNGRTPGCDKPAPIR